MNPTCNLRVGEYFGDYRPYRNPCELPCHSGFVFSGWVRHASSDQPELSSRTWRVQFSDIEAEIVCEPHEAEFLAQCLMDGLECWTSGFLMLANTKTFFPLLYSVYATRGPATRISKTVAERLASNALVASVRDVFDNPMHAHVNGTSLGPGLCHPMAYSVLMQKASCLRDDPEALRALFFVVHSEANTRSRSSLFYGQDATRLGASSFTYRAGGGVGAVQKSVPPNVFPGEVVRGCAVVGHDGRSVLSVLSALLEVDASFPTLVISERASIPFVGDALRRGSGSVMTLLSIPDFSALLFESSRVVLVSMEMLCHSDAEPHLVALKRRSWQRLVTVGWPQVSQELEMSNASFRYQTHLCLSVTEDLNVHDCLLDVSSASALLGLSEAAMQDPISVHTLLRQRVFHLSPFGDEKRKAGTLTHPKLSYAVRLAPPVDSDEAARLCNYRGSKRQMRTLFGSLCASGKGAFSSLAEGTTLLQHFSALRVRLTPFAVAQLNDEVVDAECPVCFEPNPPVVTSCGHRYCQGCLQQSLSTQRRCPACRSPLQTRDVVHTDAKPEALGPYLEFLFELLKGRTVGKTIVLASWGETHERLAACLRRKGLTHFWAWRGGAKQLCINNQRFRDSTDGVLLVDPGSDCFSLSWANFGGVSEVLVLWPLNTSEGLDDVCCQLRRAKAASPGARFVLVIRDRDTLLPVTPTCVRSYTPGLECSSCIFDGRFLQSEA